MKVKVSRESNRNNLIYLSNKISHIEHFIFFGTLLGVVREGDTLIGDDDIDFYVPIKNRALLIETLKNTELEINFSIPLNQSPYFIQGSRLVNGENTLVDFYFYQYSDLKKAILDRWNFLGLWQDENSHMLVPENIIYPIQKQKFFNNLICLPGNPEECCRYLYGAEWHKPIKKGVEYKMIIKQNRPYMLTSKCSIWLDDLTEIIKKIIIKCL